MLKLISVFDATGNQGGSVIKYILEDPLLSKEYKIRGLTSDTSKGPAQKLAQRGVEVVSADLNCVDSLTTALEGSHTIFLVTESWGVSNVELEFSQGKNVTIVARNLDVSYIIFSSLHVEDATEDNLRSFPHFDSKANIEKYIRGSGLKCTFIVPGHFMSNFTQMLKKAEGGKYQLCCPVDGKKAKFPLFDATDTGLFVKAALKNADSLPGKRLLEASGYYTAEEIVGIFSNVTGKKAKFIQVSPEQYRESMHKRMDLEFPEHFVGDSGHYPDKILESSLKLLDSQPTTWPEFVKKNAAFWN